MNKHMCIDKKTLELQQIAKLKLTRDLKGTWSQGSNTYFNAIYDELLEVKAEIKSNQQCFLEDELGDVLWDYMCLLNHLEHEDKITIENVFKRAVSKYRERINGLNDGENWDDIKKRQKAALLKEQKSLQKKSN